MSSINTIEGNLSAAGVGFCIVSTRFNEFIVKQLELGAIDTLHRHGAAADAIDLVKVPGAYELPLAIQQIAASKKYAGIIALGAIIRGSTPHFDYVAGACNRGISDIALRYEVPIGFGVLTVDTIEQAIERAGTKAGNKGSDAALSTIEMVRLLKHLSP